MKIININNKIFKLFKMNCKILKNFYQKKIEKDKDFKIKWKKKHLDYKKILRKYLICISRFFFLILGRIRK